MKCIQMKGNIHIMELTMEELDQRVSQLEQLSWSFYRALETYITVSDLLREEREEEE